MRVAGRASEQTIQTRIVPAILTGIRKGGSTDYVRSAMLALAKIGGERNFERFNFAFNWHLSGDHGHPLTNCAAPVAMGVLADRRNYQALAALARDDERGREIYGREVNDAMRAFATYGLGLIGSRSDDMELRRKIVRDLVHCLEDDGTAAADLRVAAMTAMGLVPLEVVEEDVVCYCGECKVPNPDASLGSQVTYLLRYLTADREFDPVVRSHTATTLGRLVEARPPGMSERLKEVVADCLAGSLAKHARQPAEVKQSAVLALGLVGDADDDDVDRWIRSELNRSAGHGGPVERRFALMSLAMVGSRAGQGVDRLAGAAEARQYLMRHLARGRNTVRPWAGLALGVMGFRLDENGGVLEPSVDASLRSAIRHSKTADSLGAYALAAGLRGDDEATELLIRKLERAKDEAARSYAALALGLLRARGAIVPLQAALRSADEKPLLASRAGVALGFLGDTTVVETLLETLKDSENEETRCAAIQALGFIGDERSIDELAELVVEKGNGKVRLNAVVALGFAADRAPMSWRARIANGVNYLARSDMLTSSDRSGILDLE